MTAFLQSIADWPGAVFLQEYWIAYLIVNAAHILGICLLLGSILPLDWLLLRSTRGRDLPILGPFLVRTAATGVTLAVMTGLWLFSVKPAEYVENPAFRYKAALLSLAIINIAFQHRGGQFEDALSTGQPKLQIRILAAASASLWLSILLAGRWIGFV
ncbi:DUF2214 domain-containing protein [Stutzerimonas zhaodongensis]|uniref:DUF2214 domain-containing protein n=1 Tax=Stutzerimonas zhaodongensis TaxID=1176257 RepID=UPI002107DBE1|nr:DUF2214 domain-containing protein [Stutzerimonas zhaodongensis]MCQ2028947.1 DUF2214 domain-containing protein [Stutzerimonas zhaodongensis]